MIIIKMLKIDSSLFSSCGWYAVQFRISCTLV